MIQEDGELPPGERVRQAAQVASHRVTSKLSDVWWWFMVRGVLLVCLAVLALFWPQKTVEILVSILGIYCLCDGVLGAWAAIRSGGRNGFPVFAVISLLVGCILLFWSGLSIRIFLMLVGGWAILQGLGIFMASRSDQAVPELRSLVGAVGGVMAIAGLVLVLWPTAGVVAISWLIAGVSSVVGISLLFLAMKLRSLGERLRA